MAYDQAWRWRPINESLGPIFLWRILQASQRKRLPEIIYHRNLSDALGLPSNGSYMVCRRGRLPVNAPKAEQWIEDLLRKKNVPDKFIARWSEPSPSDDLSDFQQELEAKPRESREVIAAREQATEFGGSVMDLGKKALERYGLDHEPFVDEFRGPADFYWSAESLMMRNRIIDAADGNLFIGFSAPVGWGKTGCWRVTRGLMEKSEGITYCPIDLKIVDKTKIEPNSLHHAILLKVTGSSRASGTNVDVSEAQERALIEATDRNVRHIFVVDEAHLVPNATLKALKNIHETWAGYRRCIGIVLLGQPQLMARMQHPDVLEVRKRCDIHQLQPLSILPTEEEPEGEVRGYLRHKLDRAAVEGEKPIAAWDESGLAQLERMVCWGQPLVIGDTDEHKGATLATMLDVNRIASRSMLIAHQMDEPIIKDEVVHQARSAMNVGV